MRAFQVLRHTAQVRCSLCQRPLFAVQDTRFGQVPVEVLCRACTLPAFHQARSN